MDKKISWKFPRNEFAFLKLEVVFVGILSLFIFFLSFVDERNWFYSVLSTGLFIGIYLLISIIIKRIRKVEEHYQLSNTHLHITRKTKKKMNKVKVPWKEVKRHKLDRFFLGGYVLTKKGKRHPLFFNNKREVEQFSSYVRHHFKRKK